MSWRIMVVDDEQPAIHELTYLLNGHAQAGELHTFTVAQQALDALPELKPDLLFLDVEMPGVDGLEFAARLKSYAAECQVVFVTAFKDYALDAFDLSAMDYLLKPVKRERLNIALDKFENRYRQVRQTASEASVRMIGSLKVEGPEGMVAFKTSKAEELFAYLLLHREVGLYRIFEDVFPDSEPEKASLYFHNSMFQIRQALKIAGLSEHISTSYRNRVYVTKVEQMVVDWQQFIEETDPELQLRWSETDGLLTNLDAGWTQPYQYEYQIRLEKAIAASEQSAANRQDHRLAEQYRRRRTQWFGQSE